MESIFNILLISCFFNNIPLARITMHYPKSMATSIQIISIGQRLIQLYHKSQLLEQLLFVLKFFFLTEYGRVFLLGSYLNGVHSEFLYSVFLFVPKTIMQYSRTWTNNNNKYCLTAACSRLPRRYNNKSTSNFLDGHRLNILREYELTNICYGKKRLRRLLFRRRRHEGRTTPYTYSRGFVLKPGAVIAYPRHVLNL